jgi:hypothetical protein
MNCQANIEEPPIIARLSSLDDVMHCFERLLDRRLVIPAVDLVEIDVIGAETPEARVDLREDGFA